MVEAQNKYIDQQKRIKQIIKDQNLLNAETEQYVSILSSLRTIPFSDFAEKMELMSAGFAVSYASMQEQLGRTSTSIESIVKSSEGFFFNLDKQLPELSKTIGQFSGISSLSQIKLPEIDIKQWGMLTEYYPQLTGRITTLLDTINNVGDLLSKLSGKRGVLSDYLGKDISKIDLSKAEDLQSLLTDIDVEIMTLNADITAGRSDKAVTEERIKQLTAIRTIIDGLIPQVGNVANEFLELWIDMEKGKNALKPLEFRIVGGEDWLNTAKVFAKAKQLEIQLNADPKWQSVLEQSNMINLEAINATDLNTTALFTGHQLSMDLARAMYDNTEALRGLEGEYNIPAGYRVPSSYWYRQQTGSAVFGPAEKTAWAAWDKYVREVLKPTPTTAAVTETPLSAVTENTEVAKEGYKNLESFTESLKDLKLPVEIPLYGTKETWKKATTVDKTKCYFK
jgi:hypothetical protein